MARRDSTDIHRLRQIIELKERLRLLENHNIDCDKLSYFFTNCLMPSRTAEKILMVSGPAETGKTMLCTRLIQAFPCLNGVKSDSLMSQSTGRVNFTSYRRMFYVEEYKPKKCIIDDFHLIANSTSVLYEVTADTLRSKSTMYLFNVASSAYQGGFERLNMFH
ncbi:MAG: hypothetical protein COB76_06440 [Alphaproteobacteria bacterium]|nr:MAG: hypothetical protein COB76_06440 [Alphaproteobacteria bacterium]